VKSKCPPPRAKSAISEAESVVGQRSAPVRAFTALVRNPEKFSIEKGILSRGNETPLVQLEQYSHKPSLGSITFFEGPACPNLPQPDTPLKDQRHHIKDWTLEIANSGSSC